MGAASSGFSSSRFWIWRATVARGDVLSFSTVRQNSINGSRLSLVLNGNAVVVFAMALRDLSVAVYGRFHSNAC